MLSSVAPASTVSWRFEIVGEVAGTTDLWHGFHTTVEAAKDGYAIEDARLFGPDGGLVAVRHQEVTGFG